MGNRYLKMKTTEVKTRHVFAGGNTRYTAEIIVYTENDATVHETSFQSKADFPTEEEAKQYALNCLSPAKK